MRCDLRWAVLGAVLALAGCGPKKAPVAGGAVAGAVVVEGRTPLRCSTWRYDQARDTLERVVVGGCDVVPGFYLSRQGWLDVPMPSTRDADVGRRVRDIGDDSAVRRRVRLADPSGLALWTVTIDEDELGWSGSGSCVAPTKSDPRGVFDLDAWRFLVVRVATRGPYGGLRPWQGKGDDDALAVLKLMGEDGTVDIGRRTRIASDDRDGVWVVTWCADTPPPFVTKLAVTDTSMRRGAEVRLPAEVAGDTFTVLEIVVDPTAN